MNRSISFTLCATILALLPACSWLKGSEEPPPPPPKVECDGFASQVSGIWNDSAMEDLGLTLRVYQGDLDAAGAEQVVSKATEFSNNWVTQRKDACERQNGPDKISDVQYDTTVDCLERALGNFQSSIEAFKNGDLQAFDSPLSELDNCY